jgi:hypothetical protein
MIYKTYRVKYILSFQKRVEYKYENINKYWGYDVLGAHWAIQSLLYPSG